MRAHWIWQALVLVAIALVLASPGTADDRKSADAYWRLVGSEARPPASGPQRVNPRRYQAFRVDPKRAWMALSTAPLSSVVGRAGEPVGATISLPLPDGSVATFLAREDPILDLAAELAHPEVRTYVVSREGVPTTWGRLTWTTTGMHAILFLPEGTAYLTPLYSWDTTVHVAWYLEDDEGEETPFVCRTIADVEDARAGPGVAPIVNPGIGGTQHTFVIAVQTTPGYSAWATGTGGFASVTAAVTDAINRVNAIYQRDLAIRLVLTVDTDLFYTSASPPAYADGDLNSIHADITAEVGSANFDVGISFDVPSDGGVSNGEVCNDANKARCYTSANSGAAALFLNRTAHELGHHFEADHTWSSDDFAAGQFVAGTAWEPGAGSTIMSYGHASSAYPAGDGIPGLGNPPVRDSYFHGGSIDQIRTFVAGLACDTEAATGNTPPVANAGSDLVIPRETPFRLAGTGSDADDPLGNLTYTWEGLTPQSAQTDIDQLDSAAPTVALFRSFPPAAGSAGNFERYFPELQVLADNDLFPGTTTPGIAGQQLPRVARTLAFWLTVRDNRTPSGAMVGGVHQDAMSVTVDDTSGPFVVTSPNGGEAWEGGTSATVTWDVAGTDGAPVNAATVDILLDWDGSLTFPVALALSTPNDGSQSITIPCDLSTTCRVMVRSTTSAHYFFDISDGDFTIEDTTDPVFAGCPGDFTVECNNPGGLGTQVFWVEPTVSDNCTPAGLITVVATHSPGDYFPDPLPAGCPTGATLVTYTATDGAGNSSTCQFTITIEDTTPPTASCAVMRPLLWPARGGMFPPWFSSLVTDACDGGATTTITVYSEEPNGPPPYSPDAALFGGSLLVLRADRDITQNGRVYLIVVHGEDCTGNDAYAACAVGVPHTPTFGSITAIMGEMATAQAGVDLLTGAPPAPYTNVILPGTTLP